MRVFSIVFGDLFAMIAAITLVLVVTLMNLVNSEQLTPIEAPKKQTTKESSEADPLEMALVEASMRGSALELWLQPTQGRKHRVNSYSELTNWLETNRPQELRVRMGGKVESEILQKLIMDGSRLNIQVYLQNPEH